MSTDELLDISEAVTDSPQYRGRVRQMDAYAAALETSIAGLGKASKQLHAVSADYHTRTMDVMQRLTQLARQTPDPVVDQTLNDYATIAIEIERNRQLQAGQLQQIVVQPLLDSADSGLLYQTRQARRQIDTLQNEYESQLGKLMARHTDRGERDMDAAKQRYVQQVQLTSLDYNRLVSEHRAELLESQLSLMYAQYAYHHQAFAALRDFEPQMRRLGTHIGEVRRQAREHIDEARTTIVQPRTETGGSGYVQVGQQDSDGMLRVESLDEPHDDVPEPRRRAQRRSLASISLSPHGLFQISGYLFLRSQYSLMASWQRRWFEIRNGVLVHTLADMRDRESVPLHLCAVKRGATADARRNVFELIAPNRSYVLQAESSSELSAWKACLKQAIETSLYAHTPGASCDETRATSQPMSSPEIVSGVAVHASSSQRSDDVCDAAGQAQRMTRMRRVRGNSVCADCGHSDPEWAAVNVGSLVCIECSGVHRSLGVHVSKVRSVKLDNWEPELAQLMLRLGNSRAARIYEHSLTCERPTPDSPRETRTPYAVRKYADREFVRAFQGSPEELSAELARACGAADISGALQALAQGADAGAVDVGSGRTPLMAATSMADFAMIELLLLWGADVNQRASVTATTYAGDTAALSSAQSSASDPDTLSPGNIPDTTESDLPVCGGTALHLAVRLGNVRVVWFLVRKGAHWDTPDAYGLLPLDIALEASNVQVVMALRYAAFQKASGLTPGSLRGRRMNGAEPVDMLDLDDSFIRDWAIPPYSPCSEDGDELADDFARLPRPSADTVAKNSEDETDFGDLQMAPI
ncbi:hypothetical protein IWW56_002140 [Coemansia sp. RSA 2131]|nr:hypothetical protein IWW56_002140 [Coemansia sp. RSA 2131]